MPAKTEALTYLAEPSIQYLFQVLQQVSAGDIQFPKFQRYGVWTPLQRKELLRSIREGIPLGTLLFWRTRRMDVELVRVFGVHRVPEPRKGESTRQYVLDGVQRLTTLYSVLFPPAADLPMADDGEQATDFRAFFDLREQDFVFGRELEDGPETHHLPLTALRDSVALLKFQRELKGVDAETLTERADALARAFREYKIPVVPLATDDLFHATKTFQRVNTQGTPMSEVHMVNALVYSTKFDLIDELEEVRQEKLSEVGWEKDLDDDLLLRTIKSILGIDVYATDPDRTKVALEHRPEVVSEAADALVACARFVRKQFGIRSPSLVPYSIQTVLLARALWQYPNPKQAGIERLKDWVTLTTYSELFASGMSTSRFDSLVEELLGAAQGKSLHWSVKRKLTRRALPRSFDFRHARARFVALRMAQAGAQSPDALAFKPFKTLAQLGSQAVPKLFTRAMAPGAGDWLRTSGARVLVREGGLPTLREALLQKGADRELLESHLISQDVHALLVAKKYREAVQQREHELNDLEDRDFAGVIARNASARGSKSGTRDGKRSAKLQRRVKDLSVPLCDWLRTRITDPQIQWAYHPRSNEMIDFIRQQTLDDLLDVSATLKQDASDGDVAFDLNVKLVGRTAQERTLDLALGPPRKPIGVSKGTREPVRRAKLSEPWIVFETKSCMTAHAKAIPRLIGELQQSIDVIKSTNEKAVALAVVVVNVATTFTSPTNLPGPNKHDQPTAARSVIDQVLRRSRAFDAVAVIVIDFDNESSAKPIDPRSWVPEENTYAQALQALAERYESLRGS